MDNNLNTKEEIMEELEKQGGEMKIGINNSEKESMDKFRGLLDELNDKITYDEGPYMHIGIGNVNDPERFPAITEFFIRRIK
ncbi:MAG: hypothetical protein OXU73_02490 [Candidatus Campbellbacteria bacterium]|nr:hypothetical protein [Candidatus Campbellbacteria bacterium]